MRRQIEKTMQKKWTENFIKNLTLVDVSVTLFPNHKSVFLAKEKPEKQSSTHPSSCVSIDQKRADKQKQNCKTQNKETINV